jgi:hypothetical protein
VRSTDLPPLKPGARHHRVLGDGGHRGADAAGRLQRDRPGLGQAARADRQRAGVIELGVTGLKRASGYVDEEFLPHLKGRKAVQIYREMGDNDPIASAMLFALTQLLRGVDWPVVPGGKNREHSMGAKLVETCMEDMSQTWDDTVTEILSFLRYGWSWHEIVYKRREGIWAKNPKHRSMHSDGLIGWDKIPIRSQDTLHRWLFKPSGSVGAMVQLAPPVYQTNVLPIDKSLLFRFGAAKNNPEGTSVLRGSYRPWYYKKRFEEHESIGVERDLAGLPMVKVPMEYLRAKPGTDQFKMVEAMKKMVRSVRRNEQEGIVFPTAYDEDSKKDLFSFELLTSGGSRALNVDAIIQRYEQRQLMTVLADFIMVGHQATGTYNLHVDKTGIFREALNATTKSDRRHLQPTRHPAAVRAQRLEAGRAAPDRADQRRQPGPGPALPVPHRDRRDRLQLGPGRRRRALPAQGRWAARAGCR